MICLVSSIISGVTDIDVIPQLTSFSVISGYTEGACPQMEQVIPLLIA